MHQDRISDLSGGETGETLTVPTDGLRWKAEAFVDKWNEDKTQYVQRETGVYAPAAAEFIRLGVDPDDQAYCADNLVVTAGLNRVGDLIIAAGGQAPTNTSARIGAGNGAGTAAVGDTDLSAAAGSANRWFQIMDATFPSRAGAVLSFKSTFGTADGNFAWNEWGIDIGTPTVTSGATVNATLLNHKTSAALGTKASGATWAFTVTITLS
jgi:hypothetical protein